ncbi:hypothetical protein HELRODRAFT_77987 [Helobdella robusta]|uniref:Uncharacterized protein n=1 Tax=Helobdella robusta TaxID=6412 RepID=T1G361_HELRO|nr:hypothetical protein HELRODRAFT_77987 [Helobdella robusta]ESO05269.1 hypothetical protein HELRODRAFT_77987 [Helobdella robusta]
MISNNFFFITSIFFVLLTLEPNNACFIRNCPIGGKKRSYEDDGTNFRQCPPCGTSGPENNLQGICVSENLCCIDNIGCFRNRSLTADCKVENMIPSPCVLIGKKCGKYDGVCAAKGVCCNNNG